MNVVCISLHVCERKMKSEMAFLKVLVPWFILMIYLFPFFLVYIEFIVVKWLKPLYNSTHVKKTKNYKKNQHVLASSKRN